MDPAELAKVLTPEERGRRETLTRDLATAEAEWRSVIATLGLQAAFEANHDSYDGLTVWNFVLRAPAATVHRVKFQPIENFQSITVVQYRVFSCVKTKNCHRTLLQKVLNSNGIQTNGE